MEGKPFATLEHGCLMIAGLRFQDMWDGKEATYISDDEACARINAAVEKYVQERVEEETKALQDTLEAVEHEVSRVYCHITSGLLSKANYKAEAVIGEADAYTDKIVQEEVAVAVKDAVAQEREECAKIIENQKFEDAALPREADFNVALCRIASAIRSRSTSSGTGEGA